MNDPALCFVAIGASGSEGLNDIISLLGSWPEPLDAVVMVVLHRPSDKVSALQEILSRNCSMPVMIAEEAEILAQGTCYVGEPAGHLTLVDAHVAHLVDGRGHRLRNRTIDALFQSLAEHARGQSIGIVLSGMLDDGSRGLAAIHAAGGTTMVLRPGVKPRGMQQNAIDYDGPIDLVGSVQEIGAKIVRTLAALRLGSP